MNPRAAPALDEAPGLRDRRADLLALLIALAGFVVAVVLGLLSDGVYHDDDACHYFYARDAWTDVHAMLHWWARPGYNIPTMFVARWFGFDGCRIFSAAQTAFVAWLAYAIGRRVGLEARWALVAPALVWLQPVTMALAMTTLTETPAAVYLTLAVWLYLRGNRIWACVAISPLFTTRIETLALAPLFAGALIVDALRESKCRPARALRAGWLWACAGAMIWAPVAWCVASAVTRVPPEHSPLHVLTRNHTDQYGTGPAYFYLMRWAQCISLGQLAAVVAGAASVPRRGRLVAALAVGLVVLHGALFYFGLFATGGYARFLVPGAGLFAVLGALGLRSLWNGRRIATIPALAAIPGVFMLVAHTYGFLFTSRPQRMMALSWCLAAAMAPLLAAAVVARDRRWLVRLGRAAAVIAALFVAAQAASQIRPLYIAGNVDPTHRLALKSVRLIAGEPFNRRDVLTQHVMVQLLRHQAGRETTIPASDEHAAAAWRNAEPGTLFVWESKYCPQEKAESEPTLRDLLRERGRRLAAFEEAGARAEVYVREPDRTAPTSEPGR